MMGVISFTGEAWVAILHFCDDSRHQIDSGRRGADVMLPDVAPMKTGNIIARVVRGVDIPALYKLLHQR